jgi:uncharacterized protein YdaL
MSNGDVTLFILLLVTNVDIRRTAWLYAASGFQYWKLPDCASLSCFWLTTLTTTGLHILKLLLITNVGNRRTAHP